MNKNEHPLQLNHNKLAPTNQAFSCTYFDKREGTTKFPNVVVVVLKKAYYMPKIVSVV